MPPVQRLWQRIYTTELLQQAQKMARRVALIYGGAPIVNVYEISDRFWEYEELSMRNFGNVPSEEWALFVMNNRNKYFTDFDSESCNFDCKYDVVCGPIANDDMAVLFRQYQNDMISLDMLVHGMTFRKMTSQYSFHTEKAIRLLKKVGVLS